MTSTETHSPNDKCPNFGPDTVISKQFVINAMYSVCMSALCRSHTPNNYSYKKYRIYLRFQACGDSLFSLFNAIATIINNSETETMPQSVPNHNKNWFKIIQLGLCVSSLQINYLYDISATKNIGFLQKVHIRLQAPSIN